MIVGVAGFAGGANLLRQQTYEFIYENDMLSSPNFWHAQITYPTSDCNICVNVILGMSKTYFHIEENESQHTLLLIVMKTVRKSQNERTYINCNSAGAFAWKM